MNTLVNQLFDVENISFVNQFYKHSQLKKRIMMITKEKSNKMRLSKYLLLVPIIASMLFYTACSNMENNVLKEGIIRKDQIQTKTEIIEEESIPFIILDKAPTFPGCSENDKSCFNKKIQQHFQKEFNVNLTDSLKLSPGKKRIIMLFKINKEGAIIGIKAKAPHPVLQEESIRIIKLLPIMKPGELDGEKVTVKYTLPIRIEV